MNNAHDILQSLGLHNTAIEVYLAIAENPGSKTVDIQRHTNLVRTTIYHSLSFLKAEGYISESRQNNVRSYTVNAVENFRDDVQENIRREQQKLVQIDSLEATLSSLIKSTTTDSHVSHYEGVAAIKKAIEQAFRASSKSWHVLAARNNFLYHMPKTYQQYYLSERERRCITAKTLWEPTLQAANMSLKTVATRKPRVLPDSFKGKFNSLIITYDDVVLIIDPYKNQTANAVHSKPTANLLRLMFEALWSTAPKA